MPLTAKGKKLKKKFREQYGDKKGDSIFYAMENSGKLKKVLKAKGGQDASRGDFGGGGKSGDNGRDPSKQYTTKTNLTKDSRDRLEKQQKVARGRISPSTTALGKTITYGSFAFGVPPGLTKRAIDYSPLAFGVPGPKTKKDKTRRDREEGQRVVQRRVIPIEATKPVDKNLISETDNFFNFVAYKVGGLSGGIKYGPPPKRGPNSQVPPIKMKRGGYKK